MELLIAEKELSPAKTQVKRALTGLEDSLKKSKEEGAEEIGKSEVESHFGPRIKFQEPPKLRNSFGS
jgi:hypothetical protein